MKTVFGQIIASALIVLVIMLAGCTKESTSPVSPQKEIISLLPKGTISGKVLDRCTNVPIKGAVISTGYEGVVHSTISDTSGSFSFDNVPAGEYRVTDGSSVFTGDYSLTISLVDYNKKQTDPTKRYRDFYYRPVTITFTSLVPGDSLGASGLVGAVTCSLSTLSLAVKGTAVNENLQPIAGAIIHFFDYMTGSQVAQTTSGTDGSFTVSNLDNGWMYDVYARSSDGSLEGTVTTSIPCNFVIDSLRTQVTTERIVLRAVDDVHPFVTMITPENNTDRTATGLTVVYTFSEPIKQSTYTRTDLGVGHSTIVDDITIAYNGLKKSAANLPTPGVAWNSDFTQLTLTPVGLVGSARYSVNFATAAGKLMDRANNALVNNTTITGDFEALAFTTAGGSTLPAAPTLVRQFVAGIFSPLNYAGGNVLLSWNTDANARGYNVYRSIAGGSFDLLASNVQATIYGDACPKLSVGASVTSPLRAANVRYYVTAVSKDLVEGTASNVITVNDDVKPQLVPGSISVGAGTVTNSWVYAVTFNEPMAKETAENLNNYTFSNTGGVTFTASSAVYAGYDGVRWRVYLSVTTSAAPIAGYILTASSALMDLAGNTLESTGNSRTF